MEETKTYEEFKSKVTEQPFYGSDAEAYSESDGGGDGGCGYGAEDDLRDDFSLSDTGMQGEEYCEDMIEEDIVGEDDDEERRERQFFGDEEYTILSKVEEEEDE